MTVSAQSVSSMILRVRDIVNLNRDWFEAMAAWYDSAKWTKRIFTDYLAVRNRPIARVSVAVNDHSVGESYRDRQASEPLPVWWIPSTFFKAGDNAVVVRFEETEHATITIDGVSVQHVAELSDHTRHEARPRPRPTAHAAVAVSLGAGYRPERDRWSVQVQQKSVWLSVHFEDQPPNRFLLGLAVKLPTFGYSLILNDIWDLVEDAVQDKIKDLVKDYFRMLEANDPRTPSLEQVLHDLQSYLDLHQTHMARVLAAGDDTTLAEVIEKSRKTKLPEKSSPPQVEKYDPPPRVEKAEPAPARHEQGPRKAPRPRARTSWVLRVFVLFVALGMTAAALLASALYFGLVRPDQVPWLAELKKLPNRPNPAINREVPDAKLIDDFDQRLNQQNARGGDIQVSLFWFNKNDLDLEVIGPKGKVDYHTKGKVVGGGIFDFDMNVRYTDATDRPAEHIYWPAGAALPGHYQVWVNHYTNHGKPDTRDPTRFTVRVIDHGATNWFNGELTHRDEPAKDQDRNRKLVYEFDVR